MASTTIVWYRDPQAAFLDPDVIAKILPESGTPLQEQINAMMRFAIYFGVLLSLFHRSVLPAVYIISGMAIFTVLLDYHDKQKNASIDGFKKRLNLATKDGDEERFCTLPTRDNPFMNVMPADNADFPDRPEACDVTAPDVQEDVDRNFFHKLYRNSDDIYGREVSSRQFYTMPVTTIPNDSVGFAEWLYLRDDIDGVCRGGDPLACGQDAPPRARS